MEFSRRAFVAMWLAGNSPLVAQPRRFSGLTPPRLFDIERAIPALKPYRRKAIRLHPTRAAEPLPSHASKMGGLFHWPATEPWPHCRESDPKPDRSRLNLETVIRSAQEMKLSQRVMAQRKQPTEPANQAEWQKWTHELREATERERGNGLPELTPAEMAEAEKRYSELLLAYDEMGRPHNTPYQAMVQLRRDEFPELPWPPATDLFQLLWCPNVHYWGNSLDAVSKQSSGARIVWRKESAVRAVLTRQSPTASRFPLHECSFQPEETVEYPQAEETVPQIEAALPQLQGWFDALQPRKANDPGAAWRYSYEIATAPGTKLLGYAQWIQGTEIPTCGCGRAMKLLLTCASDERLDDGIWEAKPAAGEPTKAFEDFHHPFGFEWGDWSNAYVFYCAAGHRINTATIVQTS